MNFFLLVHYATKHLVFTPSWCAQWKDRVKVFTLVLLLYFGINGIQNSGYSIFLRRKKTSLSYYSFLNFFFVHWLGLFYFLTQKWESSFTVIVSHWSHCVTLVFHPYSAKTLWPNLSDFFGIFFF